MLKGHCMAAPLPEFENEEDIPEVFREYYVEKDGKWVSNIEDSSEGKKTEDDVKRLQQAHERSKAERNEYRQQVQRFNEMLGGRDPEEIEKLFAEREKEREEQLRREQKFEEIAALKYERPMRTLQHQYEESKAQIAEHEKAYQSLYKDYEELAIDNQLKNAALNAGADPRKVEFITFKARPTWRLDDNRRPIAIGKTQSGEEITLSDLTMGAQIKDLLQEYPDMALPNRGDIVSHQRAPGANGVPTMSREALARDSINVYLKAKAEAEKSGSNQIQLTD